MQPCSKWGGSCNLLYLILLYRAAATIYMKQGATVVLSPGPVTGPLGYVKWTHDGNIAAHWRGYEITCFQQFEGRCHINTENGTLTINNLILKDSGTYRVKIDGVITDVTKFKVISPVLKPRISSECNSVNCTLTCESNITEDMEPVWFFWTIDGVQRPGPKDLIITKETGRDFSCTVKNNVSSEDSTDMKNPLDTGNNKIIIFIIIIIIACTVGGLLCLGLVLVGYFCWYKCRNPEHNPEDPSRECLGAKMLEMAPLNGEKDCFTRARHPPPAGQTDAPRGFPRAEVLGPSSWISGSLCEELISGDLRMTFTSTNS
ncbi:hypothetical protein OJAV_G00012790 [Oryzias javanicus]|uniref:Ig-like domain-containing protein n=1 Tax=Oryzias javanicus TaxID=123683 RepID=A0A437DJH1_ORYJA|nr:hypothetical protein OJAV_G00012790 [Oryzias javanicus]